MEIDRLLNVFTQNVELQELMLSQLPESERGVLLDAIGMESLERFKRKGSIDDLDRAITMEEKAVESTPVDHPDRAGYLNNLGIALQSRFERTGSMDDLHRAIATNEKAVESTPLDHPTRAGRLNNLGSALQSRFERTGWVDDLIRAIVIKEQAVESTPVNHPDRAAMLNNLGNAFQSRFERTGSMDDLDRAILTTEQAIQLTPAGHPDHAMYVNNLGIALQYRFERTGLLDDIDRAIATNQQAIESIQVSDPSRALRLSNLGIALQCRFARTGSMDDLNLAIVTNEQAVESTPADHPDRVIYLNSLGNALRSRFKRTGSLRDLDQSIMANEQAVQLTAVDHPNRAGYLNNLGDALQSRFERTGSMDDLCQAIMTAEQAVESTPLDHPGRAGRLNNLGISLQKRFERTGSIDDLNHAIVIKEQAVKQTPVDHPNRAGRLNNLGIALQRRFERTGSMDDLERAILTDDQAVESTPLDHPDRATYLNSLGSALQSRFERTGSIDDLNRAIVTNELAIKSTPIGHPNRAGYLSNLGIVLTNRFETTGLMEDLNRAILTNEQAVESTLVGHPDRMGMLSNLGITLHKRFESTRSMDDLDRAIATHKQAIESAPVDHPDCAGYLNNLASTLQSRFNTIGSMDDLDHAVMANEQAAQSDTAPPSIRLKAARSCANMLISQRSYSRAKPILEAAVHLLPRISPRQLMRSDQQFNISQFSNITSRAVSLSLIDKDEPRNILQLLELGRGILANLQLEVRSDISVLETSHPDLGKLFRELRDQIDPPSRIFKSSVIEEYSPNSNPTFPNMSKTISERRALLKRFDDLLQHIRSLKGFEDFLQGPSATELHSLAAGGAIVVFNVSEIRSDAFLVTTDEIRSVHLPMLTLELVTNLVKQFLDAVDEHRLRQYSYAMRQMNEVLGKLWDVAVKPILDELGFTQTPPLGHAWPRVWWIGSGLLNVLPLHASGYHDSVPAQTALDRVVSSYAATVKSLAYARERVTKSGQIILKESAILVAMRTTPDRNSLPFVETEINDLENLFSNAFINTTVMLNPTKTETLSALPQYTIAHFACHGYSADDPSQSSLLLQDWKISPLTVSDLISLNIESAKFAYLSACHTSAMRYFKLMDESISLSSAIQLSGYPSVVGSLWQLADNRSAEVAREVYKWIIQGEGELDVRRSAEGLHRAVCDLRDRTRFMRKTDPLVWASFIHIGI